MPCKNDLPNIHRAYLVTVCKWKSKASYLSTVYFLIILCCMFIYSGKVFPINMLSFNTTRFYFGPIQPKSSLEKWKTSEPYSRPALELRFQAVMGKFAHIFFRLHKSSKWPCSAQKEMLQILVWSVICNSKLSYVNHTPKNS